MSLPRYPECKDSGVEWLGAVPAHWIVSKFRHAFTESQDKIEQCVVGAMLSVSGYRGIEIKEYDDENRRRSDDELIGYRIVRPGQLVVNTMWLNYAGLGVSDYEGHVSPAYRSYWIEPSFHKRFVHHMMRCGSFVLGYTKFLTGIRPNSLQMGRDDLMSFQILNPPAQEQAAIATFLDHETAKIDRLIAEQEKLIALLAEKRQATISHAVTKGLKPDAPMKDSGVAWLGEVPSHWDIKRIRYILEKNGLVRGPFGGDLKKEIFIASGVKVYEQKNAIYQNAELGDSFITHEKFLEMGRFSVRPGDYIMSCSGTIGRTYRLPAEAPNGIINQALLILRFSSAIANTFADWLFVADFFTTQIIDNSQGGAMKNLVGMDVFTSISMPVPPKEEQLAIAYFLKQETVSLDMLTAEATRGIALLKERRSALISAAVTGKIDVRHLAEAEAA